MWAYAEIETELKNIEIRFDIDKKAV